MSKGTISLPPAPKIPARAELLAKLARANSSAKPALLCFMAVGVGAGMMIDWQAVIEHWPMAVIGVGIVCGGFLVGAFELMFRKKLRIEHLKSDKPLGNYTRDQLMSLVHEVQERLRLPANAKIPVYITRDKDYNASAASYGFATWLKPLNAIYLNRQLLHLLQPAELKSVIGHEFGHYYRYFLTWSRGYPLLMASTTLAALYTMQLIGFENWIGLFATVGISAASAFVVSIPMMRMAQTIEFLCDDLGAAASGVVSAINDLLKGGIESELSERVRMKLLQMSLAGQTLPPLEILKLYEEAVPFGKVDEQKVMNSVDEAAKQVAGKGMSVMGFLKDMWGSNEVDPDQLQELIAKSQVIQQLPKLNWPAGVGPMRDAGLSEAEIGQLMRALEANPDLLLFHLIGEVPGQQLTHPSFRSRVLYLWENREAIEAQVG